MLATINEERQPRLYTKCKCFVLLLSLNTKYKVSGRYIMCLWGQRTVKGLVRFNQQRGSLHRRYIE